MVEVALKGQNRVHRQIVWQLAEYLGVSCRENVIQHLFYMLLLLYLRDCVLRLLFALDSITYHQLLNQQILDHQLIVLVLCLDIVVVLVLRVRLFLLVLGLIR